ncbi:MAG: hypothetical protein GY854_22900 [Deltaproteobacteria bacterium]|nr:hypothetical protein [Deltaproteobacteria bacterium]
MRIHIVIAIAAFVLGCSSERSASSPSVSGKLVFEDHFSRTDVGPDWLDTGGGYRIVDGRLRAQGARNKPLWLKRKLPRNARVEFTARSMSPAVDIKAELWGDGKSRATKSSYTATSYVVILGGWNNSRSIIARMNEHGKDRESRKAPKGVVGKLYNFSIERKGNLFTWSLNGESFLEMNDSEPLTGPGHEHFAFNNWETEVFFDDVSIFEL